LNQSIEILNYEAKFKEENKDGEGPKTGDDKSADISDNDRSLMAARTTGGRKRKRRKRNANVMYDETKMSK
jgi:hypothetical protein